MMFWVALSTLLALAYAAPAQEFLGDLPMQNPDLFGGDMLGVIPNDRNAIPVDYLRWPSGQVPYYIDPSLGGLRNQIISAMNHISARTCIRFIPRTSHRDYVHFFKGQGCYSMVGKVGGGQALSLGQGCESQGIIIHEILHAVGFYHEQNRSDRDSYLTIYWNNIQQGMSPQFAKMNPNQNRLFDSFDLNSIMLYGSLSFSKDNYSITMATRNGQRLPEVYNKPGMSASDVNRVKKLYRC